MTKFSSSLDLESYGIRGVRSRDSVLYADMTEPQPLSPSSSVRGTGWQPVGSGGLNLIPPSVLFGHLVGLFVSRISPNLAWATDGNVSAPRVRTPWPQARWGPQCVGIPLLRAPRASPGVCPRMGSFHSAASKGSEAHATARPVQEVQLLFSNASNKSPRCKRNWV